MSSDIGVERPTSLTLDGTRSERRVHFSDAPISATITSHPKLSTHSPVAKKFKFDPDFRPKRKRANSCSIVGGDRYCNNKKRKNLIFPPTKFLLGGNSGDPLNLAALDGNEELTDIKESNPNVLSSSAANRRSGAVRVIVPPNINDPLNLDASSDNESFHTDAILKQRRRIRKRKRRRRNSEPGGATNTSVEIHLAAASLYEQGKSSSMPCKLQVTSEEKGEQAKEKKDIPKLVGSLSDGEIPPPSFSRRSVSAPSSTFKPLSISTDETTPTTETPASNSIPLTANVTKSISTHPPKITPGSAKKQRKSLENKIVSPVIPQPGGERKRHPSYSRRPPDKNQDIQPPKQYKTKNEQYMYGNYSQYYGYRNPDNNIDPRLRYFKSEWFEEKEVLDVGCNIGHVTLTIARDFNPKRAVGIDIDKKLVGIAQKNIKHYMREGRHDESHFPKSMRLIYGPLKPPINDNGSRTFPYNVKFVNSNYVLEHEELIDTVKPEFDVILCLSVTKWVHLNWGDDGLVRFFKRAFNNLRNGGKFILEPQSWHSYKKKRKLTPQIFENYKKIRMYPDKFPKVLKEIGFRTCEKLTTPHHFSPGFQRPIFIFTKEALKTHSTCLESTSQEQGKTTCHNLTSHESKNSENTFLPSKDISESCVNKSLNEENISNSDITEQCSAEINRTKTQDPKPSFNIDKESQVIKKCDSNINENDSCQIDSQSNSDALQQ